jgi:hypothetical protein
MRAGVAKGKTAIRVATRSLPKHLAGRLTERIARIKEDPALLLPECRHAGGCPRSSLERRLRRIQRHADERLALRRLSRRGSHIARAYAGALDLLFADSQGAMAAVQNPFGGPEVKFAQRGNAKKEVQAGVQNYTDKGLRMMAWLQYTRGFRGVYLFSTNAGLLCTGRDPTPPATFLEEAAVAVRPALVRAQPDFVCAHLSQWTQKPPRERTQTHVAVKWSASDAVFRICPDCVGDGHLPTELRKFALGPRVDQQLEAWVELRPQCGEKGKDSCHFDERVELDPEEEDGYLSGTLSDHALLDKALQRALNAVDGRPGGFVLAGGACRGDDTGRLIEDLNPDPDVRRALVAAFEGARRDLVLDTLSASKLLGKYWDDRANEILTVACGDAKVARRVVAEAKPTEAPATLIQRAVKLAREAAVETALPVLERVSDEAGLADRVARAFRRGGQGAALRELESGRGPSPSSGAVAWSLLLALEKAAAREWQFSKIEMERGANAKRAARRLLDCAAQDYAEALREALGAAGVHDAFELKTT